MRTATSAGTDVGSPPTVLVVEDGTALADAFADWLRRDYDVRVAYSGETALEIPVNTPIDVVLLDRHLPDVSGDEVLVTLRDRGLDARVT